MYIYTYTYTYTHIGVCVCVWHLWIYLPSISAENALQRARRRQTRHAQLRRYMLLKRLCIYCCADTSSCILAIYVLYMVYIYVLYLCIYLPSVGPEDALHAQLRRYISLCSMCMYCIACIIMYV